MKVIMLLCLINLTGFAQKAAVTFSATVTNANSDSLEISNKDQTFRKVLRSQTGKFQTKMKIDPGIYYITDGTEWMTVYFKNDFDIIMTVNAEQFDETLQFTGIGEKENNFLAWKTLSDEDFNLKQTKFQPVNDFTGYEKMREQHTIAMANQLNAGNFDPMFNAYVGESEKNMLEVLDQVYSPIKNATEVNGKLSASFKFENYNGGTSRLEDFKGKYIYIDIWATWCGPCRQEIPFLQQMEDNYRNKNITFVSISIDAPRDVDKWKKFIAEKNLGGIQLISDKADESEFIKAFGVVTIPRFILIDPSGIIVDANATRPSNPKLKKQLDLLLK